LGSNPYFSGVLTCSQIETTMRIWHCTIDLCSEPQLPTYEGDVSAYQRWTALGVWVQNVSKHTNASLPGCGK